jgi:TfoX/Sxy family transcriptional regulator of competence genes
MPTQKSAKKIAAKRAPIKPAKQATKTAARKMPSFSKAPPELVAVFEQVVAGLPMVETRKMFSYPAAFANGQMFASLFGDAFILRLPETERAAFIQQQGTHLFEPMPGKPMREYVVVPPALLKSGRPLDEWLHKAMTYAQSLPPKTAKPKRK